MIGKEIGDYRIVQKLGEGGMGVVYKAVDTNLDRIVALKLLGAEVAAYPELVERFRSEARVQAGLSHANLATLFTFLVWEGTPVMVMEFIEGETFQQILARRGPIPTQDAIPLFQQALRGMSAAHHRGIVHRDIKPANIMVNEQGIVKVMDFGIAKVLGVQGATRTNMQMGTSWYMSPEQVLSAPVDARSDIYSLGVTLYEMLAGVGPFQGDSDFAIQMAHVQREPDPPTIHYPHIPPHVVAANLKALAKKPEDRFSSVEEFSAALDNVPYVAIPPQRITTPIPQPIQTEEPRITPPPPPPPPYTPPPPPYTPPPQVIPGKSAIKWGLVAGVVVLATLVAGGIDYYNTVIHDREHERQRVILLQQNAEKERQENLDRERARAAAAEQQTPQDQPSDTASATTPTTLPDTPPPVQTAQPPATTSPATTPPATRKQQATASPVPDRLPVRHEPEPEPVTVPPTPAPDLNAVYQRLSGIWQGTYICAQGQTAASVLITARPDRVSAVMSFAVPGSPKPGTYLMAGTFSPQTNHLQLKFVRWGIQPPQYLPADIAGTVNLQQGIITGTVIGPGCSTFTIRHQ